MATEGEKGMALEEIKHFGQVIHASNLPESYNESPMRQVCMVGVRGRDERKRRRRKKQKNCRFVGVNCNLPFCM
ncbi:hypothetical protein Fmac_017379 [Flemingia macrophylla]|uniref:Uncharacterized protein n=1 Tax=Flemingia macrophylla TaxID=520843 RepID=A0ABD1M203_9FABA